MGNIDLAKRRAAREAQTVTAEDGTVFTLPRFLPATVMTSLLEFTNAAADPAGAGSGIRDSYAALFGESEAAAAMAAIGLDELAGIIKEVYQVDLGESARSSES